MHNHAMALGGCAHWLLKAPESRHEVHRECLHARKSAGAADDVQRDQRIFAPRKAD